MSSHIGISIVLGFPYANHYKATKLLASVFKIFWILSKHGFVVSHRLKSIFMASFFLHLTFFGWYFIAQGVSSFCICIWFTVSRMVVTGWYFFWAGHECSCNQPYVVPFQFFFLLKYGLTLSNLTFLFATNFGTAFSQPDSAGSKSRAHKIQNGGSNHKNYQNVQIKGSLHFGKEENDR